jgi:hypothetical protein
MIDPKKPFAECYLAPGQYLDFSRRCNRALFLPLSWPKRLWFAIQRAGYRIIDKLRKQ